MTDGVFSVMDDDSTGGIGVAESEEASFASAEEASGFLAAPRAEGLKKDANFCENKAEADGFETGDEEVGPGGLAGGGATGIGFVASGAVCSITVDAVIVVFVFGLASSVSRAATDALSVAPCSTAGKAISLLANSA